MTTKQQFTSIAFSMIIASLIGGCAVDEADIEETIDGMESPVVVESMATFNAAEGVKFASPDIAAEWREQAPGVWRHENGEQRLIIGEDGHRSVVTELTSELAELRAAGADEHAIAATQAKLDHQRKALAQATDESSAAATCSIGLYTGPSSPFTGYVGGAALAQLSCQNGTVVFTVDTLVCTGTTGCGSSRQTAVPTSIPGLWGLARSGSGSCYSDVFVAPANVGQSSSYICN